MKKDIQITTLIGKGAECDGAFSASGSVRIDGIVNGNVTVTGTVTIGATGRVNGDLSAQAAIIGGEVYGNVTAPDRTELIATAKVIGDITTAVIVVDEKAVFQGRCDMNQEVATKRKKPASKAIRTGKRTAKAAIAEALREVEAANRAEELNSQEQQEEMPVAENTFSANSTEE